MFSDFGISLHLPAHHSPFKKDHSGVNITDTGLFKCISHINLLLAGAHRQRVLNGLPASVCAFPVFAALQGPAIPLEVGLFKYQ